MSKYNQGGRGISAARPPRLRAFLRPPFILKGRALLVQIDRLVAAGLNPETAVDTALWYVQQGDMDGLEAYVQEIESRSVKGGTLHTAFISHR